MTEDNLIKPEWTLAEAAAVDAASDHEHWSEFPEVLAAFSVVSSGRFEFEFWQADALLSTLNPDDWEDDPAYVSAAVKLRDATAEHLGWDRPRMNRTMGWNV